MKTTETTQNLTNAHKLTSVYRDKLEQFIHFSNEASRAQILLMLEISVSRTVSANVDEGARLAEKLQIFFEIIEDLNTEAKDLLTIHDPLYLN